MKTLVLTAHPDLASSRINRTWFEAMDGLDGVTRRDLTSVGGPTMRFDPQVEQALLLDHDRIVFQFPFYWYSAPPVMKAWLDQVMTYGFAYGPGGDKLKGRPFQQTVLLAGMTYLRPFVAHGMAVADLDQVKATVPAMLDHLTNPELDLKVRQARLLKELEKDPEKAAAVS